MEKVNEGIKIGTEGKSRLVQMRLQPRTLERLEKLSDLTKITNKTQLISSSIQLTAEIIKSREEGAKVYLEFSNGKKEVLNLIGL